MSADFETTCPVCDSFLVVCCEAEPPAPEIGRYFDSFDGFILEQECKCELTTKQVDEIAENYFQDLLDHY